MTPARNKIKTKNQSIGANGNWATDILNRHKRVKLSDPTKGKIPVRIDERTVIYIAKGSSPQQAIENYQAHRTERMRDFKSLSNNGY